MNTVFWFFQAVLALMMLMPGFLKLTNSNAQLIIKGNGRMNWAEDLSETSMKIIGVIEVLIAFGLILPQLLGILTWLTPLAAIGAICTMLGAISLHVKRKDGAQAISINLVIIILASVVIYGRFEQFNF